MLLPRQRFKLARGTKDKEHAMSEKLNTAIAVIGIDIGKNSFHVVGHDQRGAIVLHQKWSRGQVAPLSTTVVLAIFSRVTSFHSVAAFFTDSRTQPCDTACPRLRCS